MVVMLGQIAKIRKLEIMALSDLWRCFVNSRIWRNKYLIQDMWFGTKCCHIEVIEVDTVL